VSKRRTAPKLRILLQAAAWSLVIIAFPVLSGVIAAVTELPPVDTRLVQAVFMLLSLVPLLLFCRVRGAGRQALRLTGISREGLSAFYYGLPLPIVFLPALLTGLQISDPSLSWAALLFTVTVGIAEELYFRGLILHLLEKAFRPGSAVALSSLLFGFGHAAAALATPSPLMVALIILSALIFGWLAAEAALLLQNILPLMLFHALFNFIDYHMKAQGKVLALAYFFRGAIMLALAAWLLVRRKQYSHKNSAEAPPPPRHIAD